MSAAQNLTICTVCDRMVGAKRSWDRDQAGQSPQWKVTRHRRSEKRASSGREQICTGTGIVVAPAAVWAREQVSA